MKIKIIVALMAFALVAFTTTVSAQAKKQKQHAVNTPLASLHKVVIQLSSADTLEHKGLLMNLKNLKQGWGDSVLVEVVVHGPGIDLVTKQKSTQNEAIQQMIKQGVRFVVCRNTMKQKNITEEQILPNVEFVPMAIAELIRKQEQGWSYLKAGF